MEKRPSWGRRFSAIFNLDKILIRVDKPLNDEIGGVMMICSTPSIRIRTVTCPSWGSR